MTIQDPTVTRAELAIEEAELIDGGPAVSWGAIFAGASTFTASPMPQPVQMNTPGFRGGGVAGLAGGVCVCVLTFPFPAVRAVRPCRFFRRGARAPEYLDKPRPREEPARP